MKYLAGLLLLFSSGASAANVGLRIDCDPKCSAWPDSLQLESGDHVVITSTRKWTCAISGASDAKSPDDTRHPVEGAPEAGEPSADPGPSGPRGDQGLNGTAPTAESTPQKCNPWTKEPLKQPTLFFESKDASVEVPYQIKAPSHTQTSLPFLLLTLGWLVFALGSLVLGVMLLLASQKPAQMLADWEETLQKTASQLKGMADGVSSALNFAPLPLGTSRSPQAVFGQGSPELREPKVYDRFITALDRWSSMIKPIPPEIVGFRKMIENTGGQINPGDLQTLEQDIVEIAVAATDRDFDVKHWNESQQLAIQALIEAAGLKGIFPKQGDAFDPDAHRLSGQRTLAQDRRLHGRVATVVIRGLERGGRVIKKAEVSLYD